MRARRSTALAASAATVMLFAGCSGGADASPPDADAQRVLLVSNQPLDPGTSGGEIVADGLDVCAEEGWETQSIVVADVNQYESTLRTAARDGYDLIATTFPPMSDATVAVADESPDTDFVAIYQFTNTEGEEVHPNIASSSFSYEQTGYLWGVAAATLSEAGRTGVVNGMAEPGSNTVINGVIQGAASVRPDLGLTVTYTNSYTDPAKGSENTAALLNDGVDLVFAMADQSNIGVIDTAKDAGALVIGDTAQRIESYPEGIVATQPLTFGEPLADACRGEFAGGEHTVYQLSEAGGQQILDEVAAWAEASGSPRGGEAVDAVNAAWEAIRSGELVVEADPSEPGTGN
ncbi:BMP family ABC transporter substrate-binding protein [Agromyces sp. NPDC058126]|uniref:BMP family ABC transporter substrate-binding protein n=1 Tax=Agromyces sp. NPDC058126 TaxID=3346350 RepID=UPI0036DB16EA